MHLLLKSFHELKFKRLLLLVMQVLLSWVLFFIQSNVRRTYQIIAHICSQKIDVRVFYISVVPSKCTPAKPSIARYTYIG